MKTLKSILNYFFCTKFCTKQTIAQQLNITEFPFKIRNKAGDLIYKEWKDGAWSRWKYDSEGMCTYFQDSDGLWVKREYDEQGNQIYYEDSNGLWEKSEYDEQGELIYFETPFGILKDN
jgi:hypothetical protein